MARKAKDLSALEIGRLTKPGHYAVGGVAGLYLYVSDSGARSWVLRTTVGTKRRHMGLGSFPETSLARGREKARIAKDQVELGIDPIAERARVAERLKASQILEKTFDQAAQAFIDAHGDTWKSAKHRAQWVASLATYASPTLGRLLVREVAQGHVLTCLEPIWKSKNETASRLRGRIESVLDWAAARGLRSGDNPARWKGHLDKILPAPSKVQKVVHHRALPIKQMPSFMKDLKAREGLAARALEFVIYCAARSGEVRGARWTEIDLEARVWIIPATRMKANKEHRVPLSQAAIELLKALPRFEGADLVFPGVRGGMLSDMTLTAVLRRMAVDAVPHGFRSTFRDWAGENTNYPRDMAEQALAHALVSKVEAAYRRGDALEKRRVMMSDWAAYCLAFS